MADDFLKQLQLSKQIEQKAKEAAKVRKAAEEKIAAAEEALTKLKATTDQTAEAERFLVEASNAFKEKDYKNALAQATQSINSSHKAQAIKVEEIIASAQVILQILRGRDVAVDSLEDLAVKAKETLEKAEHEEAQRLAQECSDRTDQLVNRVAADAFNQAQTELMTLEKLKLESAPEKLHLASARKSLDEGRYKDSLDELDTTISGIRHTISEGFRTRQETVQELLSFGTDHTYDLARAQERLGTALAKIEAGQVEVAFADISAAEAEARGALMKGTQTILARLRDRATVLREAGHDTTIIMQLISSVKERNRGEDLKEAHVLLSRTMDALKGAELDVLARSISAMGTKIQIARRVGADMGPMQAELDNAKQLIAKTDLKSALASVERSASLLETSLAGYQETQLQLEEFRRMLDKVDGLKLGSSDAAHVDSLARISALKGDFPRATSLLKETTRDLQTAVQAHFGREVIRIEMDLATALRLGSDVTDESEDLDALVDKIKRNKFGIVEAELTRLSERAKQRIGQRAEKTVQDAKRLIEQYSGPMDLSEARSTMAEAVKELGSGNHVAAFEMAQQATESLKKEEIKLLDARMAEAGRLLAIMHELECKSITLKDKFEKAEEMRRSRMFAESMKMTGDVIQFANSIIKDELSRQMTNVGKTISISRKKGMEVSGPDRLMEESWRLLNMGNIERSYGIMQEAVDQLQTIGRQHTEIYDLIAEVRGLIHEAGTHNMDTKQAEDKLEKAQQHFEGGKYDEARERGRAAFQDAERMVAPFIAPKRLAEVNELLGVAFRMKLDTTKGEDLLSQAEEFLGAKDFTRALMVIREAKATAIALMSDGLVRDIYASRSTIEKSKSSGQDMTTAEIMLQKAEGMMQEGRYNDAWRAIELAKSELDQSVFMEQRATDYIHQAEVGIQEATELDLDMTAAHEVFRQAGTFHRQGNFALATELAKKAYQIACDASENKVLDRLKDLEDDSHMDGLSGPDLASLSRKKEQIQGLVTKHHYKDALFLIGPYEEELNGLRLNRDKARAEMEELDRQALDIEGSGMLSEHSKQLLQKSREKFREGSFAEARSLIARCKDDLASLGEMHESRQRELKAMQEDLQFIIDPERKKTIGNMLEQAEASLKRVDFERTSLFLRRARAALLEATGFEVGRYFEELMALNKVMERAGLIKAADEVKNGQFTKMYDMRPKDLVKLRTEVENLRWQIHDELDRKLATLVDRIERAMDAGRVTSASERIAQRASALLKEGDLEGAQSLIVESEGLIGVAEDERAEFIRLKVQVNDLLVRFRPSGIDVNDIEHDLAQVDAALALDPKKVIVQLAEMKQKLDRRMADLLPDVGVDIDFLDDIVADKWVRTVFRLTNHGRSTGKQLKVTLNGPVEMRGINEVATLRPGETAQVKVTIRVKEKGDQKVTMTLACRSALNDQDCGYDNEMDLVVK